MPKFYIKGSPVAKGYWEYCVNNDVPMIEVIHGRKYSKVNYDIYPMLSFHEIDEALLDEVKSIYNAYGKFFSLPSSHFAAVGGYSALIITVYKEHAEFIAEHLFDFLCIYVRMNRKPFCGG